MRSFAIPAAAPTAAPAAAPIAERLQRRAAAARSCPARRLLAALVLHRVVLLLLFVARHLVCSPSVGFPGEAARGNPVSNKHAYDDQGGTAWRVHAAVEVPARGGSSKRSTAKRSTAKRSTAKRSTAKRSTAKRATAKRSTVKRATAKRSTAKRAASRANLDAPRRRRAHAPARLGLGQALGRSEQAEHGVAQARDRDSFVEQQRSGDGRGGDEGAAHRTHHDAPAQAQARRAHLAQRAPRRGHACASRISRCRAREASGSRRTCARTAGRARAPRNGDDSLLDRRRGRRPRPARPREGRHRRVGSAVTAAPPRAPPCHRFAAAPSCCDYRCCWHCAGCVNGCCRSRCRCCRRRSRCVLSGSISASFTRVNAAARLSACSEISSAI